MAITLFNRSGVEAKRPPVADLETAGKLSLNYNSNQPSLYFGVTGPSLPITAPPYVGTTAPLLNSGDAYALGQMWFQPQFSLGPDLKIWNGGSWTDALANGLAGFTSGESGSQIGWRASFLGKGATDPLVDSYQLTAVGFNTYSRTTPLQTCLMMGIDTGRFFNKAYLDTNSLVIGPECGGSTRGGIQQVTNSIMVGWRTGTYLTSGGLNESIWLGCNVPYADGALYPDTPPGWWSSNSDIFISQGEEKYGLFRQWSPTISANNTTLGDVTSKSNIVIGAATFLLTYPGTAPGQKQGFNITNNTVVGAGSGLGPSTTNAVYLGPLNSYGYAAPLLGSYGVSLGYSGVSTLVPSEPDGGRGVGRSVSIGTAGPLKIGVNAYGDDTMNVTIKWASYSYSQMKLSAASKGGIFLGEYSSVSITGLTDPVFFSTNNIHRWLISNGAWAFNTTSYVLGPAFAPDYGQPGAILRSQGSGLPPTWNQPAGATGTFELPDGRVANVENGIITSYS